jgi:hypothetical protein
MIIFHHLPASNATPCLPYPLTRIRFSSFDWVKFEAGEMTAPYSPSIKHSEDMSHFDTFNEQDEAAEEAKVPVSHTVASFCFYHLISSLGF